MTGRDLIIYILENGLEDSPIFENGVFIGLMTEEQAAVKFHVGAETVRAWHALGMLNGIKIGDMVYIFVNAQLHI